MRWRQLWRTAAALSVSVTGAWLASTACGNDERILGRGNGGAGMSGSAGSGVAGSGGSGASASGGTGASGVGGAAGGGASDAGADAGKLIRRPIAIVTTDEALAGVQIFVPFDVADAARADGGDVRVVAVSDGAEQARVFDMGPSYTATGVWFRLPAPIAANTTDTSFELRYGDPNASPPSTAPWDVFDAWDDFEDATSLTSRWEQNATHFAIAPTGDATRGAALSVVGPVIETDRATILATGLTAGDLWQLDAEWRFSSASATLDLRQVVRASASADYSVRSYMNLSLLGDGSDITQTLGRHSGTDWSAITTGDAFVPAPTDWYRLSMVSVVDEARVFNNGTKVVPPVADWTNMEDVPPLPDGGVGFVAENLPDGVTVFIDNVRARRRVQNEPTVTLGAPQ